jgi:hypothetical protein
MRGLAAADDYPFRRTGLTKRCRTGRVDDTRLQTDGNMRHRCRTFRTNRGAEWGFRQVGGNGGGGRIGCNATRTRFRGAELTGDQFAKDQFAKEGYGTLKLKSSNRMPFSPNDLYKVRYALGAPAGERILACPSMVEEERG